MTGGTMSRYRAPLIALMTLAVVAIGACGGTTASPIADPKEILVKAVEATQAAKTVHMKLEFAGTFPIGDLGSLIGGGIPGASAAPSPSAGASSSGAGLKLDGTTAEGDVDLAKSAVHLGFSAPALLGLSGDLIVVDRASYLKVSLLGDKYQRLDESGSGASPSPSPAASPSASGVLDELRAQLDKLKTPPQKLADEKCGDTDCYHVKVTLDQADTSALESLAPGMSGTGTLDAYVRKNDLRPSQLVLKGDSGTASGLTITATLSGWDAAVDIKAPSADQVGTGGFPFGSFAIPSFGASPQP